MTYCNFRLNVLIVGSFRYKRELYFEQLRHSHIERNQMDATTCNEKKSSIKADYSNRVRLAKVFKLPSCGNAYSIAKPIPYEFLNRYCYIFLFQVKPSLYARNSHLNCSRSCASSSFSSSSSSWSSFASADDPPGLSWIPSISLSP